MSDERREAEFASLAEVLGPCRSAKDGDCAWSLCPQEHAKRKNWQPYCPLARYWEAKWAEEGYDV